MPKRRDFAIVSATRRTAARLNQPVVVSWAAIPEAEVYLVEVKNEETEDALLVEVPAPMTSFEVPASWLEPAVKHQVVVGVRTPSGNITNVESAFFTAAE